MNDAVRPQKTPNLIRMLPERSLVYFILNYEDILVSIQIFVTPLAQLPYLLQNISVLCFHL